MSDQMMDKKEAGTEVVSQPIFSAPVETLPALFAEIFETRPLFLPVSKAGEVNFGLWEPDAELALDACKTVRSAKDFFFPQSETLYTVYREGRKLKLEETARMEQEFVLFGLKGCDVRGLEVLDRVFLADPADSYYQARREHGILITLACSEPESSCFCTAFQIDPAEPQGDVTTWKKDGILYWRANSKKGVLLTKELAQFLKSEDAAENAEITADIQSGIRAIAARLPLAKIHPEALKEQEFEALFASAEWETSSSACLGCGTCTFVCPTCQCYDIKDYQTKDGIERYRCWDSCMYSDFTMMAHGNPRTTQLQRFRQRFLHKLVYFPENNDGMYSCVGCGRCVEKCPSSLNIVKVIKAFGGGES